MTREEFTKYTLRRLHNLQEKVAEFEDFPCTLGVTLRQREGRFRADLYIYAINRNASTQFIFDEVMSIPDVDNTLRRAISYINDAMGGRLKI